ncbi:hypothetical protein OW715_12105 [Acidithiobacillus ferriphilus]|nr:hypothetical protein [Acidithiobacillus ferriphilus]
MIGSKEWTGTSVVSKDKIPRQFHRAPVLAMLVRSSMFFIPSKANFVPEPVKVSRISFQDGIFALVEDNGFRLPCPAKDK